MIFFRLLLRAVNLDSESVLIATALALILLHAEELDATTPSHACFDTSDFKNGHFLSIDLDKLVASATEL